MKFIATKKGMTTNFFSPLSFVAVFGSGNGKNQDPGSGTNIPDPQHCQQIWYNLPVHMSTSTSTVSKSQKQYKFSRDWKSFGGKLLRIVIQDR